MVGILLIALAFIPLVLLGRWWAHRIRESESDRMLRHLRSYFGSDFPLARLSTNYPDLVMQTRRALYGNPFSCDRSLRELDSDWYTIQKEHSDRTSESS
ncbi:MAG TPA: hypothetical protein PK765_07535 [bacterium]|nr:hypothetical protein [bacterium]